jgi:DNA-binding NarL/FixJ family response regulator
VTAITVVVADDHPLILKGISEFFRRKTQIRVVGSCASGEEALNAILAMKPDVALLDIRMPNKSGFEVLSILQSKRSDTKVIFLTGTFEADDVLRAVSEGAYGLLSKDSELEQMLEAIKNAAHGHRTFPLDASTGTSPLDRDIHRKEIDQILSRKQWKVVSYAARGLSNKEIALKLNITEGTAKVHLHRIFKKLGVKSRTALASLSFRARAQKRSK